MWPTIIASTVVSWSCVGDVEDRAVPRHAGGVADRVAGRRSVPWWMTTTCTLTPCCREALRLGLDPRRLGQERQALGRAGRRPAPACSPSPAPMTPTLTPLTVEHLRRRHPVGRLAGRRRRRCWWRGTGSWPAPGARAAARRRSRTRGCRRTSRPGPTRSRRRSPACPRAAPSSAARRRRCRRRRGSGPGRAATPSSSSNIVAR